MFLKCSRFSFSNDLTSVYKNRMSRRLLFLTHLTIEARTALYISWETMLSYASRLLIKCLFYITSLSCQNIPFGLWKVGVKDVK